MGGVRHIRASQSRSATPTALYLQHKGLPLLQTESCRGVNVAGMARVDVRKVVRAKARLVFETILMNV